MKSTMLTDLNANAGKVPFQTYTIQHGIERVKVAVPFAHRSAFEAAFGGAQTTDKAHLLEIVEKHGGKLME
jgi:hypothetical protein